MAQVNLSEQKQRSDLQWPGGRVRDGLGIWGWQMQIITFRMDKL